MTNYEDVVNEKKISYYKKSKLEIDENGKEKVVKKTGELKNELFYDRYETP